MSVLSKLTLEDKEKISSYINEYGKSTCEEGYYELNNFNAGDIDYRLRLWDEAKSRYLEKMFGDDLIKKVHISYEKAVDEIDFRPLYYSTFQDIISDFCWQKNTNSHYPFKEPPIDYIYEYDANGVWLNPINQYGINPTHRCINLYNLFMSDDNLYDNIYHGETFSIKYFNETLKIQHGMKVSRIAAKVAKIFNIDDDIYEEWRIKHSQLINTKLVEGNLCFSIHPLDYLTMSDGSFTSCMSWTTSGGYRQGTVEMMNSSGVVVVYLESDNEKLKWWGNNTEYEWNYKKWRTLMIVDGSLICSVKGYPYQVPALSVKAVEILSQWAAPYLGKYEDKIIDFEEEKYCIYKPTPEEYAAGMHGKWIYFLAEGAMYCDFGTTTHYMKLADGLDFEESFYLNYCGPSECMWCGAQKYSEDFYDEGSVFCTECCTYYSDEDYCRCTNCGNQIWAEDAIWNDDYPYCDYCASKYLRTCAICENTTHIDDAIPVFIKYKGYGKAKSYRINNLRIPFVCASCADDLDNYIHKEENENTTYTFYWQRSDSYYNSIKQNWEQAFDTPIEAINLNQPTDIYSWSYITLDLEKTGDDLYNRYHFANYDFNTFDEFVDYIFAQEKNMGDKSECEKVQRKNIEVDLMNLLRSKPQECLAKQSFIHSNFLVDPMLCAKTTT